MDAVRLSPQPVPISLLMGQDNKKKTYDSKKILGKLFELVALISCPHRANVS